MLANDVVADRELLDRLFDDCPDCVQLIDASGIVRWLNRAAETGTAHPAGGVGRSWLDLWPRGPHRESARRAWRTALGGTAAVTRGCLPAPGAAPTWWAATLTPVRGRAGEVVEVMAVARDISTMRRLEGELDEARRRADALVLATSEIVWQSNAAQEDGKVVSADRRGAALSGSLTRTAWIQLVHPDDRERVDANSRGGMAAGRAYVTAYRLRQDAGTYRWVEDRVVPLRDGAGTVTGWVGVTLDIEDRVAAERACRESEERLRLALQASHVGIWDVDLTTGARTWTNELKAILGLPPDAEASEGLLMRLVHPEDRPLVEDAHRTAFVQTSDLVFRIQRADGGGTRWILSRGRPLLGPAGTPVRRLGTFQDITERKRTEHELWRLANRDPLTGLPNRAAFATLLADAVAAADVRVALLVVNLDGFKDLNDARGHDVGDAFLIGFADRLSRALPTGATAARLAGDEFAILLREVDGTFSDAAAALFELLSQPLALGRVELPCPVSVGLAVYPDHDPDGGELLKNADLALMSAKRARARLTVFDPSMKAVLNRRVAVLARARDALALDRLVPYYQPKVEAAGGAVAGFEALLRWRDGSRIRSPGEIAAAFEDPELAEQIGIRMLRRVVADLVRWRAMGLHVGSIAVNAAAAEFGRGDLAERWLAALGEAGLPSSALHLEVTESVFLGDGAEAVGDAVARLHDAGIAIALDDFGTGYASLAHLRRYPVQWLKIDRSFTRDLAEAADARAIVSGVVDLAHAIGCKVVAEGVETRAQLAHLRRAGCDELQGYLIAKPMPAGRVPTFLRGWAGLDGAVQARTA